MADASNLVMPKLGLTMTEGTITEWRVKPGQGFDAGQVIAVVETEKIANEIEAPGVGVMEEHIITNGETVAVGTPIARWTLAGGGATAAPLAEMHVLSAPLKNAPAPPPAPRASAQRPDNRRDPTGRVVATPLARRIAREKGVDLSTIAGSGPGGRIKAADVSALDSKTAGKAPRAAAQSASCFLVADINANEMKSLLGKLPPSPETGAVKFLHIACLAVSRALTQCPRANKVIIEGGSVKPAEGASLGIVDINSKDDSILVLRDTSSKTLMELVGDSINFETRRKDSLGQNIGGGSTVVVDASDQDISHMNFPVPAGYSSALVLGELRETFRPNADQQPALVQEVGLVLTYDQSAIDHAAATEFFGLIKKYLETPLRLLAG
jgi:pyruvate dehydrogenase E2 component (dihydrolipoamide acetyltransferase)